MAKYQHRLFEMYEFRDEATRALTPKTARPIAEGTAPESWNLTHLDVSRDACVTHVKFRGTQIFGADTLNDLRKDFSEMSDCLVRDSRVLIDFTGVTSFCAASIGELDAFKRQLRSKGSRIVLCCLDPTVHESFFERSVRSQNTNRTHV